MFTRTTAAGLAVLTVLLGSAVLLSQAPSATPSISAGHSSADNEFPVIMRQTVVAGATTPGSKVEAKLAVATLVDGVVVPQGAILSGEVIESVAKSASGPSRLGIRMGSAQWKNGGAPKVLQLTKKVYLTACYYPLASLTARDLSNESWDTAASPGRRGGSPPYSAPNYPTPNSPASQPFPGRDPDRSNDTLSAPSAPSISQHRVLMKNVESTRNDEGAVILVSKRSSVKLDKTTTYVLSAGDLGNGPG
jgi:hypothetical protein